MAKINLLINLPAGFFSTPVLKNEFKRLKKIANLRQRSHNSADEIARDLAWADAVFMWSWPKYTHELLGHAPRLKFSGHLDIPQSGAKVALERGLAVSVTRRAFSPAVSELALGLILSTLRRISVHHAAMRSGKEAWVQKFPDEIHPHERQLTGRAVGIVGFGAVGQRLGELLAPFRCQLRVFDPHLPDEVLGKFNATRADLDTLIRRSEIVILCAASNPGTRHLLGEREIGFFQDNAVLVNVARAALVDTAALTARLRRKNMYAALDVFDREPLERNSPLRKLSNAFLTPHRAGGIFESVERIIRMLGDDLEAHLAGRPRSYALTEKMLPALDA